MGMLGTLDIFWDDVAGCAATGATGLNWIKGDSLGDITVGCLGGVWIGVADPSIMSAVKGLFWPSNKSNSVWTVIGDSGIGVGVATGMLWAPCCWMASNWDWSRAILISLFINWLSRSTNCCEPIGICCWSGRMLSLTHCCALSWLHPY